jgi:hypothetical protein
MSFPEDTQEECSDPMSSVTKKIVSQKGLQPSGYKSLGSTSGPGFDSSWERISQYLTAFVLSVVGDVPVDSEASVVISSILRICRHSLRRCS